MHEPHPGDDRLLDLVNRLLPDTERQDTLDHLRACAPCAERLRVFAATHERAQGRRIPHLRVIPIRAGVRRAWSVPSALLAAAAVLAITLLGAYALLRDRPGPLPSQPLAWLPDPEPTVFQRDSTLAGQDPGLTQGLAAYRRGDAREARRLLRRARATGALEQVRRIYLGSAELILDEPRAALRTLKDADLKLVPEPWRGEALWSLAAAYRGAGHSAAADSLWRLLAAQPGEVGERARRALAASTDRP